MKCYHLIGHALKALVSHISPAFIYCRWAELLQALHTAASRLKSKGWAVSNKKTYQAQLTCYLDFCAKVNLSGVPASPKQIILYIAYMVDVKSLKYSTIKNSQYCETFTLCK